MAPLPIPTLQGTPIDTTASSSGPSTTFSPWNSVTQNPLWDYFYNFRSPALSAVDKSPYAGTVGLRIGNVTTSDANSEYVVITVSRDLKSNLTATGWSVQSGASGISAPIGEAAYVPFLGDVSVALPIVLAPGSTMYVTTGRSPNGVSFRTSKCTGYFEQFQNYSPPLQIQCPTSKKEMLRSPEKVAGNDACISFVENIKTCEYKTTSLPGNIGLACQDFILNTLNYSGCIRDHKADPDFYGNEWRLFLKRDQELYKNTHDRIRLLDENKKLISEASY
jgi:hypothetical protein